MIVRTEEELEGLKKAGKAIGLIRDELIAFTKPGVTTKEIDVLAGKLFKEHGAVSAPKAHFDFPGNTCICVNTEVAHGIPGKQVIKEGDLVNIDVSGSVGPYFADTGRSFVVGTGDKKLHDLVEATDRIFEESLESIKVGSSIRQIGRSVGRLARKEGYKVIKNLTGHGVGHSLRDEPEHIFNYDEKQSRGIMEEGIVLAFEPFISTGAEQVYEQKDGWTLSTKDGSYVAQIEHTIVVTKDGLIITTA
ncbi:type I methionyl aminopeptidase [Paenalkalicoccus suaedae]|uniref:Methionine aminopeptidase n=1 Tax=Paenalkalicoccus suaedae TaxID=2592382 RepID=A0A859FI92_9BACI|nr:type I methionyl aminopeptidase [Paenalkalicoccus suaedae]QKS72877.1 type I methionyl aminopeptidase [Paenalkalicoccus suaedae]